MSAATATIDVRKPDDAVGIVDIKGDITASSEDVLMQAYAQVDSARAVILNFTRLEYMNSSGVGLLVTLLVRTNRARQRLMVYGLTDHYREIFELTRLDEAILIYDDEQSALAAI